MRAAAERVRTAYADVRAGGTHQARLERDIAWDVTQRRLADLDIGESPLVFGRLDLERRRRAGTSGRLAVEDEEPHAARRRLAGARSPSRSTGPPRSSRWRVVRRRHLITRKGREVIGLDDEVFDQIAVEDEGLRVAGEGALLAALERNRTGRMGDIVATIQAEQDEAIRADVHGRARRRRAVRAPARPRSRCTAPRTCSTRTGAGSRTQGVLLVGPSPVFLRYIEQVLPSLGEQDVQLSTISGPEAAACASSRPTRDATARAEGRRRAWRASSQRAVADRERPLRARPHRPDRRAARARVALATPRASSKAVRRRRGTHNENRPYVARRLYDLLVARYKNAAIRAYRERSIDAPADNVTSIFDRDSALDASDRGHARARRAAPRRLGAGAARPLPRPARGEGSARTHVAGAVGRRARQRPVRLPRRSCARRRGTSSPTTSRSCCTAARDPDVARVAVDRSRPRARRRGRLAARSGRGRPARARAARSSGGDDARHRRARHRRARAARLRRRGDARRPLRRADRRTARSDASYEPRTFGHVLVDEAQDLTAMQWRMLARRCPSGSMTLVGDPGQASQPGAVASWDDVLVAPPARTTPTRFVSLSINYRTPAEVMDVASPAARGGRADGRAVAFGAQHGRVPALRRRGARRSRRDHGRADPRRAEHAPATVAVIAPPALHAAIVASLADVGAVADVGRRARRADRGARPDRRQGPRVRPRHRRRARRARERRSRRAAAALCRPLR